MKFVLSFILICSILSTCISAIKPIKNIQNLNDSQEDTIIIIDTSVKYQVIHNFGASDAWTCQFVGLWPDAKRNRIADLLFSTETDANGQPIGIGLSLWRFNIGSGSNEQKNINDEWRSTESFLNSDGTYDWTKQAGQQWFLKEAQKRGVDQFIGFTNSPPVYMTKNGKAFSDIKDRGNIEPVNYIRFSKFLVEVANHFRLKEGITFNYLSPFNEPQWDWTNNGQEGTPFTNQEMYGVIKILDSIITVKQMPFKIMIGEAGKINYLYEDADRPSRGDQINAFFNKNSPLYIGSFPTVEKSISAHSYFTSAPVSTLLSVREKLNNQIRYASIPLEFWQSEYCILGDQEEIHGNGKDLGINTALYVARLIHFDLTLANASAWHWWLAVSAYDYKDGLIYVDKNKTDGNVEDSKLLWALGNFSRFIRPGSVRVETSGKNLNVNNARELMASSYLDPTNKKLVTVLINYGLAPVKLKIQINGETVKMLTPYITSGYNIPGLNLLSPIEPGKHFNVPARSVVTLVGDIDI